MPTLIKIILRPCPHFLLSATILPVDVDVCTNLLGNIRPNILRGLLDCRNIKSTTHITGDSVSSLKASAANDFIQSPNHQQIWYTHSRTNAEGSLSDMAENLIDDNEKRGGIDSVPLAFVGTDGVMVKTTTMNAI